MIRFLAILIALPIIAIAQVSQASPKGATLTLSTPTGAGWSIPATVEITVTHPGAPLFVGSNGMEETGGPVFSSEPFQQRATFYRCDTVTGFPAGGGRVHNRLGGSSFIAQKEEPDGTVKTWICASIGSFVNFSYWEFQIRYFSGDPMNNIAPSMVIATVPGSGQVSSSVPITDFDVKLHTLALTMHRVNASAVTNATSGGIDTPLQVSASLSSLEDSSTVSIAGGLVADGVTPLLFKIESAGSEPIHCKISASLDPASGSLLNGDIGSRLLFLKDGMFVGGDAIVPLDSTTPTTFAYLFGIRAEDVMLAAGRKELEATLRVQPVDLSGTAIGEPDELKFKIRKPPIVLAHGMNGDASDWGDDFVEALEAATHPDFIRRINYGVVFAAASSEYYPKETLNNEQVAVERSVTHFSARQMPVSLGRNANPAEPLGMKSGFAQMPFHTGK